MHALAAVHGGHPRTGVAGNLVTALIPTCVDASLPAFTNCIVARAPRHIGCTTNRAIQLAKAWESSAGAQDTDVHVLESVVAIFVTILRAQANILLELPTPNRSHKCIIMVRFQWQVEDGYQATIPPGGIEAHGDIWHLIMHTEVPMHATHPPHHAVYTLYRYQAKKTHWNPSSRSPRATWAMMRYG